VGLKEDLDNNRGEATDKSAGSLDEDKSMSKDSTPKGTWGKQIQDLQDRADAISKLQQELKRDIQVFKVNHLQDCCSDLVDA